MVEQWLKSLDNGKLVGSIFLDFRKAFDLVDHEILLHKLKLYHFSDKSLCWFKSYLRNRQQAVKIGDKKSHNSTVITGVPQGSILGPLLFLIYVNDLPLHVLNSEADMYADDSTIYYCSENIQDIESNLQKDLKSIEKWCSLNNMALNPNKTTSMLLCCKQKIKSTRPLSLYVNNICLKTVTEQKVLGLHIDQSLEWKTHVNAVYSKVSAKISLFKRISKYLTLDMKKLFYNAYIMPIFDYCCTLWSTCNQSSKCKLAKLQKRAARLILCVPYKTPSYHMFKQLSWLPIRVRFTFHIAIQVYKAINRLVPEYYCKLITVSENKRYPLRSHDQKQLTCRKPQTQYLK
jgi:hypothetical protein